jgi:hypothetical protein
MNNNVPYGDVVIWVVGKRLEIRDFGTLEH